MKKILIAVGVVGALSGAAQAQSSVTVYGIIDAGYVGGNSRVVSPTTGVQTKTTVNQFGQNAESSSRLGLRGNEDLGGGTSAFFTAEFQLYPTDATLSGNSNSGGNLAPTIGLASVQIFTPFMVKPMFQMEQPQQALLQALT